MRAPMERPRELIAFVQRPSVRCGASLVSGRFPAPLTAINIRTSQFRRNIASIYRRCIVHVRANIGLKIEIVLSPRISTELEAHKLLRIPVQRV